MALWITMRRCTVPRSQTASLHSHGSLEGFTAAHEQRGRDANLRLAEERDALLHRNDRR